MSAIFMLGETVFRCVAASTKATQTVFAMLFCEWARLLWRAALVGLACERISRALVLRRRVPCRERWCPPTEVAC